MAFFQIDMQRLNRKGDAVVPIRSNLIGSIQKNEKQYKQKQ